MAELEPEGPSKKAGLRASVSRKRKTSPQPDVEQKRTRVTFLPSSYRFKGYNYDGKLKNVTPSQRVQEYPDQPLACLQGELVCNACREEISLFKSVIQAHIDSRKHVHARRQLEERESEMMYVIHPKGGTKY